MIHLPSVPMKLRFCALSVRPDGSDEAQAPAVIVAGEPADDGTQVLFMNMDADEWWFHEQIDPVLFTEAEIIQQIQDREDQAIALVERLMNLHTKIDALSRSAQVFA